MSAGSLGDSHAQFGQRALGVTKQSASKSEPGGDRACLTPIPNDTR